MSPASVTTNSGGGGAGAMPKITIMKRSRADVPFAQRKFLKKTKRGKVMKGELMGISTSFKMLINVALVLRERYLRSDIPCGYACCTECATFPGFKPVLPSVGYTAHRKLQQASPAGHWLIVDTNIVLHQMDLLISLPTSMPLIIPSTVLAETRHRSLPLYNRLQQLIADEEKKVWVFWNEERRETATKVEKVTSSVGDDDEDEDMERSELLDGGRESVNDRNDRGEFQTRFRRTSRLMPIPTANSYSPHGRFLQHTFDVFTLTSDRHRLTSFTRPALRRSRQQAQSARSRDGRDVCEGVRRGTAGKGEGCLVGFDRARFG